MLSIPYTLTVNNLTIIKNLKDSKYIHIAINDENTQHGLSITTDIYISDNQRIGSNKLNKFNR